VFFRTGIVKRREHQIPLSRIQNIETVVTFWGRMLGYGSLIVDSAADQPLEFPNVASVHKVQGLLNQLIADDRAHEGDDYGDGTVPPRSRGSGPDQPHPTQAYPTEGYPTESYPAGGQPSPNEPTRSVRPPGTSSHQAP
jgi:hypothetical protein